LKDGILKRLQDALKDARVGFATSTRPLSAEEINALLQKPELSADYRQVQEFSDDNLGDALEEALDYLAMHKLCDLVVENIQKDISWNFKRGKGGNSLKAQLRIKWEGGYRHTVEIIYDGDLYTPQKFEQGPVLDHRRKTEKKVGKNNRQYGNTLKLSKELLHDAPPALLAAFENAQYQLNDSNEKTYSCRVINKALRALEKQEVKWHRYCNSNRGDDGGAGALQSSSLDGESDNGAAAEEELAEPSTSPQRTRKRARKGASGKAPATKKPSSSSSSSRGHEKGNKGGGGAAEPTPTRTTCSGTIVVVDSSSDERNSDSSDSASHEDSDWERGHGVASGTRTTRSGTREIADNLPSEYDQDRFKDNFLDEDSDSQENSDGEGGQKQHGASRLPSKSHATDRQSNSSSSSSGHKGATAATAAATAATAAAAVPVSTADVGKDSGIGKSVCGAGLEVDLDRALTDSDSKKDSDNATKRRKVATLENRNASRAGKSKRELRDNGLGDAATSGGPQRKRNKPSTTQSPGDRGSVGGSAAMAGKNPAPADDNDSSGDEDLPKFMLK
jgi:hypothetical protein